MNPKPNRKKLCQFLVEFFEVAIHSLLRLKHIYPDVIFVRKQKYGNVVYETVHPQLKEYIFSYMEAVYHFAIDDQLVKIAICFFDKTYKVIKEKVIFDVAPARNKNTMVLRDDHDTLLVNLEKTFRSFFMNLNSLHGQENKDTHTMKSEELKFALQIYTTETNVINFMENSNYQQFPWVQVSSKYCRMPKGEIIPFDIEENDFINMQIYIEK